MDPIGIIGVREGFQATNTSKIAELLSFCKLVQSMESHRCTIRNQTCNLRMLVQDPNLYTTELQYF